MRRAAKVDVNQPEIVKALRQAGATVQPLHTVGKGCPDLLVGHNGQNILMEVKNGKAAKLTVDEEDWARNWRGQTCIVRSVNDAIDAINKEAGGYESLFGC